MSAIKWSLIFLLVIFPFFLLTGDYMAHNTAVDDASTATRDAAQSELKANIVKNSLRDANAGKKDSIVVKYNPDTIQTVFNQSLTRNVVKDSNGNNGYITVAGGTGIAGSEVLTLPTPYPTGIPGFQAGGQGNPPPMIAIRSNVVRNALLYGILSKFSPASQLSPYDVIQTQEIAILEAK